jgi:hypothetical protein
VSVAQLVAGRLRRLTFKRQLPILRLIENRFLYDKFWLSAGAALLCEVIPEIVDIMIEAGVTRDWGEVCFPPITPERTRNQ